MASFATGKRANRRLALRSKRRVLQSYRTHISLPRQRFRVHKMFLQYSRASAQAVQHSRRVERGFCLPQRLRRQKSGLQIVLRVSIAHKSKFADAGKARVSGVCCERRDRTCQDQRARRRAVVLASRLFELFILHDNSIFTNQSFKYSKNRRFKAS